MDKIICPICGREGMPDFCACHPYCETICQGIGIERKRLIEWLDTQYTFNHDARALAFEVKDNTTPQIYLSKMHFIIEMINFIEGK